VPIGTEFGEAVHPVTALPSALHRQPWFWIGSVLVSILIVISDDLPDPSGEQSGAYVFGEVIGAWMILSLLTWIGWRAFRPSFLPVAAWMLAWASLCLAGGHLREGGGSRAIWLLVDLASLFTLGALVILWIVQLVLRQRARSAPSVDVSGAWSSEAHTD
jgi:hypothetical protein